MNHLVANSETVNVTADAVTDVAGGTTSCLGSIHYSGGTIEEFEKLVCHWLQGDRRKNFIVGYVNPHVFNIAWKNPDVREFLAQCDIAAVDGLGVALAVCLIKRVFQSRTVMTPLFDRVLAKNHVHTRAILIGGDDNVVSGGAGAINRASGAVEVTVKSPGYQPLAHYLQLIDAHPECDVVLVAMGSPRSEELILAASKRVSGKLLWNIGGGTLHFYAGTQARTPHFVSAIGMQWLWRIIYQPSIAPRYIIGTPLFLARLFTTLVCREKSNAPRL